MMAIQKDISIETLVNLGPQAWAQWTTGQEDLIVRDFLHLPCRWVKSDRDLLIQVKSPRRGEFLILNRWELYYNGQVGNRIMGAAAMAREKYGLPVYPVLVNILRPSRGTVISNSFQFDCLELRARQDCRVINLWDVDVEVAFSQSLTPLLPFAPIMKGGRYEAVLKRAAIVLEAEKGFEELEKLLAIFGTIALGVELVERVMNLETDAFRASPLAVLLKREGQQEASLEMLTILIETRFGEVPKPLQMVLPSLDIKELQELAKLLLNCATINELLIYAYQAVNRAC